MCVCARCSRVARRCEWSTMAHLLMSITPRARAVHSCSTYVAHSLIAFNKKKEERINKIQKNWKKKKIIFFSIFFLTFKNSENYSIFFCFINKIIISIHSWHRTQSLYYGSFPIKQRAVISLLCKRIPPSWRRVRLQGCGDAPLAAQSANGQRLLLPPPLPCNGGTTMTIECVWRYFRAFSPRKSPWQTPYFTDARVALFRFVVVSLVTRFVLGR